MAEGDPGTNTFAAVATPPPPSPPRTNGNGHRPARALTAAGQKLDLRSRDELERAAKRRAETWQVEAMQCYDAVGPIKYAYRFLADVVSRVRLFVAYQEDQRSVPVPVEAAAEPVEGEDGRPPLLSPDDASMASDALARLDEFSEDGLAGLQWELAINLGVPGECHLVGMGPRDPEFDLMGVVKRAGRDEVWSVKSILEVNVEGTKTKVKTDHGGDEELNPETDFITRLWQKHPFDGSKADSNMRPLIEDSDELLILKREVRATATSRIASRGLLGISNKLSFGPADPTRDESDTNADPFMEDFMAAATAAITNEGDAAAALPVVLRGDVEDMDKAVKHWDFAPKFDQLAPQLRKECLDAIMQGLPLPPEVIAGHQQTTFANAAQVDRDTFSKHIEPFVVLLCSTLTTGFLRPQLLDESVGMDPETVRRLVIWYDPSEAVTQPDQSASANEGWDRGLLSDETWMRVHGFDPSADRPDDAERLERTGMRRGILTAELTAALIRLLADQAGIDLPDPAALAPGGPPAEGDAATASVIEAAATPRPTERQRSDLGRRLVELDRRLRDRLLVAADAVLRRGLERAGAKVRSKAAGGRSREAANIRDAIEGIDNARVASTVGQALVAALRLTPDELLEEALDPLAGQFDAWVAAAQREALTLVTDLTGPLEEATRAALSARQATDRAEAWRWLFDELKALATRLLFDPAPAAPEVGEADVTLNVSAGLIRSALARAGGDLAATSAGPATGPAGIAVQLEASTTPPAGVAWGDVIRDVLTDAGGGVEGYEWDYGVAPRTHPFEPHRMLHGYQFANFDDPGLAIDWPGPFALPGDHDGCLCDVVPIILQPMTTAQPEEAA